MHLRTWIFIIETIIVIPPIVLYIAELKIILTAIGNEFASPFFSLFVACGVTDIIGVILSHFFYALPMAADIAESYTTFLPTWTYTAANALLFYLPIVEDFLNISIALNRCCAIWKPVLYNSIWTARRAQFAIFLCFALAFGPTFYIFASPSMYLKWPVGVDEPPVYLLYPLTKIIFPNIPRTLVIAVTIFSCNGISAVINLLTVCKLMFTNNFNAAEQKLIVLGIALFIANIPSFAYQLYFFLDPCNTTVGGYVVQCLPWINILKCLLHPILLFVTNSSIRHTILSVSVHLCSTTCSFSGSTSTVDTQVRSPIRLTER